MEIHISIQTTEPLTGSATTEDEGPLYFEGWLELLRVLSTLMGAKVASAGRMKTSQEWPPAEGGG